jgi:copper transport protein
VSVIAVLSPALAAAHAVLVGSEPRDEEMRPDAPDRIIVRYDQELETRHSTLQVFDAEGRLVDKGGGRVDLNDPDHASMVVGLPVPLPSGSYTVRWTAISAEDGDRTEGRFVFRVTGERPVGHPVAR